MTRLIKSTIRKCILSIAIVLALLVLIPITEVAAYEAEVLGVHILGPQDLDYASKLLKLENNLEKWHYLTVPLALKDLEDLEIWQQFFNRCSQERYVPIVRLATRVEGDTWTIPTRKEIVSLFEFMDQLPWPTKNRYIIAFNEVNHAKEWGGRLDPVGYTQALEFVINWAHTERASYKVMPAAMDLAAPNDRFHMEAFNYLSQMLAANPWIFDHIDYWNSHSYPNPAFSSSPTKTGQNSLRGFEHELNFIQRKTSRKLEVFITETGWVDNRYTRPWLTNYYLYALQHIWTHPQVKGVTPFLLRGAPGPFAPFSFFDESGSPTVMFEALREGVLGVAEEESD